MKPTWGIRKLNEYSIDKDTAIIITDTEKDNYYWSDIPDGSLLVNTKTGSLSIKLIGESDWVPMGIRKDGTDKLVKDAVINVEYYVITKIEKEKNQFNYVDSYGITRTGKLTNGKVQFKVGSGLYLPGTNQLEILINDVIRCSASDNSLQELNMKYFQIDEDNIRVDSSVTVRYINYERLSELYPLIYTQDEAPWFFEDKDIWINTKESNKDGLNVTPLSYTLNYLNNDTTKAELIVFTTKGSRLIATHRDEEYYNNYTTRNITKFKIPRNSDDYYLNLFSTFDSYETAYSKILISGTKSKTDKVTIDGEVTYLNNLMSRATVTTQIGNFVSFFRDGKKVYSSQNLDSKVSWNFPREAEKYDIVAVVENIQTGIRKEKTLSIKAQTVENYADINHVISDDGITITVRTLTGSVITVSDLTTNPATVIKTQNVDNSGNLILTIPLAQTAKHYRVTSHNEKTEKDILYDFNANLHTATIPLAADQRQHINTNNSEYGVDITYRTEPGSTILIKNSSNQVLTRIENTENGSYYIPYDYQFDRTFTVESIKEDKVPESKVVFVSKYEKVNAPISLTVSDVVLENRTWMPKIAGVQGSTIKVEVTTPDTTYVQNTQGGFATSIISNGHQNINDLSYERFEYTYKFKQINDDISIKFICEHPLYKTQEVLRELIGLNLREWNIILKDSYVINPYGDIFDSLAYRVFAINFQRMTPDAEVDNTWPVPNSLTVGTTTMPVMTDHSVPNEKALIDGMESYKFFYNLTSLRGLDTLPNISPRILDYTSNVYVNKREYHENAYASDRENKRIFYFAIPVSFEDLLVDKEYQFKINNRLTNKITVAPTIAHYKNFDNILIDDTTFDVNKFTETYNKISGKVFVAANSKPNTYKKFIPSIKYIHPQLINYINIEYYLDTQNNDYNLTMNTNLNKFIAKLKSKKVLSLDAVKDFTGNTYGTGKQVNWKCLGNISLTKPISLRIDHKILLWPSTFSYKNYNFQSQAPTKMVVSGSIGNNEYKQEIWMTFSKNDLDFRKCVMPIHRIIDFENQEDLYVDTGFTRENSNQIKENSSSNLRLISYDNEYIPSQFNNDFRFQSSTNIYYFPELKEVDEFGLTFSKAILFLDYSKINKFHHFAFGHIMSPNFNTTCVGVGRNVFYYGDTQVVPSSPTRKYYEETTGVYNPRFSDMLNMNIRCPFPMGNDREGYVINVISKDNKDVAVSAFTFNQCNATNINWYCKSITFCTDNNEPIRMDTMDPYTRNYDKINRQYYAMFGIYGIPQNPNLYGAQLNNFYGLFLVKELDLRVITNLYIEQREFNGCANVVKIILPSTYLIKDADPQYQYSSSYGPFYECKKLVTVENLDNYICTQNFIKQYSFAFAENFNTEVNLNYTKKIGADIFYLSGASTLVYRKLNVNRDHLGNIINLDGYLENKEKNIDPGYLTLGYSAFAESRRLNQASFDLIKDRIEIFTEGLFYGCNAVKECVIQNNKVLGFVRPFDTPLNKIVIDSSSIKIIQLRDSMFNDEELFKDRNNYKINAPNLEAFNVQSKGGYSTFYTINTPKVKVGSVQPKAAEILPITSTTLERYKTEMGNFLINSSYEEITNKAKEIKDYGPGNKNSRYIYFFDKDDPALQQENLTLYHGDCYYLFPKDINLSKIKVKKLHIYGYNGYYYYEMPTITNSGRNVSFYGFYFDTYESVNNKKYIEALRWPALQEIIFHTKSSPRELTILGVKIKYVQDQ